jgi:ribonuclease HI
MHRVVIGVDISLAASTRRASWAALICDGHSIRRARGSMTASTSQEAELLGIARALRAAHPEGARVTVVIDSPNIKAWLWGAQEPPADLAPAIAQARAAIVRYRAELVVTKGHARGEHILHKTADALSRRVMRDREATLARAPRAETVSP